MATRNLAVEKNAIDVFAKTKGKLPSTSQDWADVHKMAYPSINDLPDEFKATEAASYYGGTGTNQPSTTPTPGSITPPATNPLPQDSSGINGLKTDVNSARANLDQLSSPNSALNVLQEAIKTKTQSAKAPIGTSEIFKQAGVDGFGALAQSLSARGTEISTNATDFKNIINSMSGTYKDMAETAKTRYEAARDAYNTEVTRIQKIQDDLRDNEQQIKLVKLQHDLQADLERVRNSTISPSDRLNAMKEGYEYDEKGNLRTPDPTTAEADALADAIAQHESGGNFGAKGATGESGAFQFMPATWNIVSQQYAKANGINQSLPMTAANEDKVARWKIGQLLASGKTPREVALIWNGSLGGSEEATVKSGTNSKGVKYDTGAYANSVLNILKQKSGSTNSAAASTAQAIFSGTSNLKVSDLPTKDRDAVNKELVKLKNQAIASGDTEGLIRASAGGSAPSDNFKTSFEKGINVISQIGDLRASVNKEATGPIMGIIRSKNPYDSKAQLIKAQLNALVPNLARGVYGEVGVLTDKDIEQYAKTLPTLTSTEDVNKLVLGATIRSVQRSLENKLKVQAGAGTDVSGLLSVYQDVKAQADSLLGASEGGSSASGGGSDMEADWSALK